MACRTCSKIRCKIYGIVSGRKTKHKMVEACGYGNSTCAVYDKIGYNYTEIDLGTTWKSFKPFLKKLKIAFINRFKKA